MGLIILVKSFTPEVKVILVCAAVLMFAAFVCVAVSARMSYPAKTMRLLHFQSGYALNTGADGLMSVSLDDTKIIALQNDSRAEFQKIGKRLELKLTSAAVFSDFTDKLNSYKFFVIKPVTG